MTRTFLHSFDPPSASPVNAATVDLDVADIEDAGIREVLQTPGAAYGAWSNLIRWVGDLLAMQDGECKDQLHDIAHIDGCGWSAAILHFPTHHTKIVRHDLRQQPVSECRQNVALVDGAPHSPRAVRHARLLEPLFAELAEPLRLLQSTLVVLLLLSRRPPLRNGPLRVD